MRHAKVETMDSNDADETVPSLDADRKSIVLQLADVEFQTLDDNSQDLFDNDSSAQNSPSINFNESSRVIGTDSTNDPDLIHTPKIWNRDRSINHPTVPKIPTSLVPFISNVNESWNSELETPQAKTEAETTLERREAPELERFSKSFESAERKGGGSVRSGRNCIVPEIKTPSGCFVVGMEEERLCTSPILNTTIKRRRRPKRRILKSLGEATSSPKKATLDSDAGEDASKGRTSFSSAVKTEETLAENSADVNDATFVIDDNFTSSHNSNIRLLENEEEVNGETDKAQASTSIENLVEEECSRNGEKRLREGRDSDEAGAACAEIGESEDDIEEQFSGHKYADVPLELYTRDAMALETAQFLPINRAEVPKAKKELGFITFTELCSKKDEYCENEDAGIGESKDTESTGEKLPISSSLHKDVALSLKEGKNSTNLSSLERDETPTDIDEFSPWFYHSNEAEAVETKKLAKNNPRIAEVETTQQINCFGVLNEDEKKPRNSPNSCGSIGFCTAGGKPIQISKERIKIAEKLYNEISLQDGTTDGGKSLNNKILGCQFASNKENEAMIPQNSYSSMGFSTAGGIPIKISEEKLRNAEKLYSEISLQDEKPNSLTTSNYKIVGDDCTTNRVNKAAVLANSCDSMGFSTAGGIPIKISEEKLKNAEKLYNETSIPDEKPNSSITSNYKIVGDDCISNRANKVAVLANSYDSMGFSTAGGKPIKISEENLKNAEKLYNETSLQDEKPNSLITSNYKIVGDDCISNRANKAAVLANSYDSMGFSTAGGKPIKVSEEKLKAAEKLYQEVNSMDKLRLLPNVPVPRGIKRQHESHGADFSPEFTTACERPLIVGETAIKRARVIPQREGQLIDSENIQKTENFEDTSSIWGYKEPEQLLVSKNSSEVTPPSPENESNQMLLGFCRMSGKASMINFNDLSRIMRENTPNRNDQGDASPSLRCKAAIDDNLINALRQTDNNNHAGHEKSKALTKEEEVSLKNLDSVHRPSPGFSNSMPSVPMGFSTAGGKSIKISDQALSKARSLLEEEKICEAGFSVCKPVLGAPRIVGFSSANGERLSISDQALTKAKILLAEEETGPKSSPSLIRPIGSTDMIGFSTADGKRIKISEDALLKAKKSLEIDQENTPPHSAPRSVSEKVSSDETPVGSSLFHNTKRLRFNSEFNFQARKLFSEEDFEMEKNQKRFYTENGRSNAVGAKARPEMFGFNDRLMSPELEPQKCWPLRQDKDPAECGGRFNDDSEGRLTQAQKDGRIVTYSEEITASTEALLADENSMDGKSWASGIALVSAATEDRDICVRPITIDGSGAVVQETPTSPRIGARIRPHRKIRRNKKQSGLKVDGTRLKMNRDNDLVQDQILIQDTQRSSSATSLSSDSSKGSHRIMSPFVPTVPEAKLEGVGGTCSTRAQFSDGRPGILLEVVSGEMDDNFFETRIAATLEQEKRIRAKKKFKPKPIVGSLLLRRMSNKDSRISWREATNGVPPVPKTSHELMNLGIAPDAVDITAATALSYKFKCSDFYSKNEICSNPDGLDMGDGFRLIFDEKGCAGAVEFEQAFLAGPGVDTDLIPERWVGNHYRWIVWKLAFMDRTKFGDLMMPRMLTPRHIMEQLKYRYDREIDKSERPALRRIIEKDDAPSRRMVLCVATIIKLETVQGLEKSPKIPQMSHWKVELTDGWYSVPATIDSAMANLIAFGKVREGTKLVTSRAELLNCDQGCSPLEIPGQASLKIHTNSTRRCRWDAKLGFCKYSSPIPTSLSSVLPNGGLIGKLDTIIARVYPIQYFEKTWSGQSIFRNNRCEDKAAMKYEAERQAQIDSICAKAQANFEARDRRHSKISAAAGSSEDPDSDQACIAGKEQKSFRSYDEALELQAFQTELESILRQSLPPPRKVTLVLKVRLMGGDNPAILTVWAPSEDMLDSIKEGNRVFVDNVQTSGKRSGDLQLTAGHQSFLKLGGSGVSSFPERRLTSIPEASVSGFNPPFGEFDTVGIVVSLGPAPHGMRNFEVVDLAYPPSCEASGSPAYLSILFWEGIGSHGFSDILTIGSIVACNNLQWRRGAPRTIPLAYSTEHSTFTRNPRQNYLRSALELVRNRITDAVAFVSQCAVEIALERQKKSTIVRSPAVHETPSKASPFPASFQDRFAPGMSPQTPQGPPNTGKDSTPAKYSIQRRLDKLQWYGEPPDLSPVTLNHSSTKFKQRFIPPERTPEH